MAAMGTRRNCDFVEGLTAQKEEVGDKGGQAGSRGIVGEI